MNNSYETVIANTRVAQPEKHDNKTNNKYVYMISTDSLKNYEEPHNKTNRKYKYITLGNALKNYNAKLSNSEINNENTGFFLDAHDKDAKEFIAYAQKEIEKCIENGEIDGSIELRGRKANAFTLRVPLKDDKGSFQAGKFFDSKFCKESRPGITAVTLYVTQEQIRGLRISQDDRGVRLYEIINGSYTIKFNWKVDNRYCSITVSVDDDGNVTYSDPSQGLKLDDLRKNTAVNIAIGEADKSKNGEGLPKKLTLEELVLKDPELVLKDPLKQVKLIGEESLLEQESYQEVGVLQQPSSQIDGVSTQHTSSAARGNT